MKKVVIGKGKHKGKSGEVLDINKLLVKLEDETTFYVKIQDIDIMYDCQSSKKRGTVL